uniref:C-type lectin domain-containing protein n=1 Tax=Astyanax mexicanus TaxID=7994 RepID=A0A8B9J8F5_ASTMX
MCQLSEYIMNSLTKLRKSEESPGLTITVSVFASAGLLGYSFSQLRQYHYVGKSMNWFDAQSYCRRWFTDLATLNSINEVSRVLKVIDPAYTGSFWIGLKRGTYSKWGWSAGNNTLYSNWEADPNVDDTEEGCATKYRNGGWFPTNCNSTFQFNTICGRKLPFLCYKGQI